MFKEKSMDKIGEVFKLAMEKFRESRGGSMGIKDGDKFAVVFNDAVLVISFERGDFHTDVIDKGFLQLDMNFPRGDVNPPNS